MCCNGFCKLVKEIFGCGQSETTNDSDNGPSDNLNDKDNNIDNNNIGKEVVDNNINNDPVGETLPYNVQKDKKEIDLSGVKISKNRIIFSLKCVFLSATISVGKTSIIYRLQNQGFSSECYVSTSDIDFSQVIYKEVNNKVNMQIQLVDTPCNNSRNNQENFEFGSLVGDTNAIVFVYDINNYESFKSLEEYISKVEKKAAKGCLLFLLGNKLDIPSGKKRLVTKENAQNFANGKNLIFLGECSAKEDTYMPDKELYYKKESLQDGKCKDGLSGMLKDIIWNIHKCQYEKKKTNPSTS